MRLTLQPSARRTSLLAALVMIAAASAAPHPARGQNPISSKVVGSDVARRNRRLIAGFRHRENPDPRDSSTRVNYARTRVDTVARAYGALVASSRSALEQIFGQRLPTVAERRLLASEVAQYFRLTNATDTLPIGDVKRREKATGHCIGGVTGARPVAAVATDTLSAAYLLELLCNAPELERVVPDAVRLALVKMSLDTAEVRILGPLIVSDSFATNDPVSELICPRWARVVAGPSVTRCAAPSSGTRAWRGAPGSSSPRS